MRIRASERHSSYWLEWRKGQGREEIGGFVRKLALVIVFELVDAFVRPNDTTVPSRSPVRRFRKDGRTAANRHQSM